MKLLKFAFTHHPTCKSFRDHLYNIKGLWICKGCAVTYPLTLLVLLFSFMVNFPTTFSSTIAITALFTMIIISISMFREKLALIRRILFGVFTGSVLYFLLSYGDLLMVIFGLIFLYIILLIFSVTRYYRMKNICKHCEYSGDWDRCDGFLDLKRILFKDTIWEIDPEIS